MSIGTCPVCDSVLSLTKCKTSPYPSESASKDVPKRIIFCNYCGLGIADPMPSDEALARLYNDSNYWSKVKSVVCPRKQPIFPALARSRWSLIQSHLDRIKEKPDGLKILDIGAGFGYLGIVAANSSEVVLDEYCAVEPDPKVRSALEDIWPDVGNNCRLKTFAEFEEVTGRYDIVVLSHLLEHVKDPMDYIKRSSMQVPDNGFIFVDVPNRDDLFKADVFPHLFFFSLESLRLLLKQVFINVVDLDTWGNSRENSPLNSHASVTLKNMNKILGKFCPFMPGKLSIWLLALLFQVNVRNEKGTWIRLLGHKGMD